MNPLKPQLFVYSFEFQTRKSTEPRKAKKPPVRKPPGKPKVSKPSKKAMPKAKEPKPRVEPTPEQVEAKVESRRAYDQKRSQTPERKELHRRVAQARRDEAKKLGLCRDCPNPTTRDRIRCETCAAKHQASRARRTAQENAAARHSGQGTMF